ncbi:efflux RND transporter periplasmic adaptor subunit [Primorskyibacter sp. S187A]|uniref:efflux RND transporter periplasmic adaptor subunit n=1 Tax=Primorskyibacter sp. S187A TaxID=3415130 RepID=UPI003C7BD42F
MRFLRQSLTGLFLLSLTLGLFLWAGTIVWDAVQERMAQEPRTPPARERVFAVNVVEADPTSVTPILTAFGEVQSRRTLEIRASAAGQVVELSENFEDGAHVEAGQVLARIDPANAEDAVARARTDLQDAQAEQAQATAALILAQDELAAAQEQVVLRQRAFDRQNDLSERGVGTATAVETAELAASSARQAVLTRRQALATAEARLSQAATQLERMRITLSEAERQLADTTIRARFAGTLSDVAVVEGGLVSNNERLARLVDPLSLEVAFRVSIEAYARLLDETGQLRRAKARVKLDVLGVDLVSDATLVRDSAAVGEGQTGRLIFARLDTPRGLKPGDFVTVEIEETPLDNVVRLPSLAVNAAGDVLVIGSDERLETMRVNVLRRQGNDVLVRARGLSGRAVVAERTPLLGDGIKVRALNPGAAPEMDEPELLELSEERRAKIRAFVEANNRMPSEAKARILGQLEQPKVPARMVARIESRMGG